MMPQEISWLMPLLLLPGIALLINASSTRYSAFQMEIHHLLSDSDRATPVALQHLHKRALMFQTALVALHLATSLFAIASLLGALLDILGAPEYIVVFVLTSIGIVALLIGAVELSREARLSHEVILSHIEKLEKDLQS